jgi:hypothetical protein
LAIFEQLHRIAMIQVLLRRTLPILLLICPLMVLAQIQRPVKWSFSAEKKGSKATLILKAKIDAGWHVYSQDLPVGGPIGKSKRAAIRRGV